MCVRHACAVRSHHAGRHRAPSRALPLTLQPSPTQVVNPKHARPATPSHRAAAAPTFLDFIAKQVRAHAAQMQRTCSACTLLSDPPHESYGSCHPDPGPRDQPLAPRPTSAPITASAPTSPPPLPSPQRSAHAPCILPPYAAALHTSAAALHRRLHSSCLPSPQLPPHHPPFTLLRRYPLHP